MADPEALRLEEGRFARFTGITWWRQDRLACARVLVIGAGALGNEVVKNLALLGVGHIAIADLDRIELSNLSRSSLFRASDEGRLKSEVAAEAARAISPSSEVIALPGNILAHLGRGWFRWADAVVGAVDNREARVHINRCCARFGIPWIDGGIEVLNGLVRGFHPPVTPCYECTMSETDWAVIDQRRSCSMLARRALASRGTPTTPTTASVIGAIQVQEVIKLLHGLEALLGAGFFFEGGAHSSYRMSLVRSPACPCHEEAVTVRAMPWRAATTTLGEVLGAAEEILGGLDGLDLERDLVARLDCPGCGRSDEVWSHPDLIAEAAIRCPGCATERSPTPCMAFAPGAPDPGRSLAQVGVPPFDILFARRGERVVGLELAGDAPPSAPRRQA